MQEDAQRSVCVGFIIIFCIFHLWHITFCNISRHGITRVAYPNMSCGKSPAPGLNEKFFLLITFFILKNAYGFLFIIWLFHFFLVSLRRPFEYPYRLESGQT